MRVFPETDPEPAPAAGRGRQTVLALLCAAAATLLAPLPIGLAAEDEKPYRIASDGVVDWYTFSGFRRYHADCHVCHGPDGLGSSFGPPLTESMKTMDYGDFAEVVINGRKAVGTAQQSVMPGFGENRNVACFIDDIYAYLKARADGALGRGRPKKEAKPPEATERDNDCLG